MWTFQSRSGDAVGLLKFDGVHSILNDRYKPSVTHYYLRLWLGTPIPPGFLSGFLNFDLDAGFFSTSDVEGLLGPLIVFHLVKMLMTVQAQAATMRQTRATSLTQYGPLVQA